MAVPLLDLKRSYETLQSEIEAAALRVLRSGRYILGDEVTAFERQLADYLGVRHVIGMSSGTDALLAALMGLDVGPGDRVLMPVYSFFATAGVVARLGATPVFVDIEPTWCNLDRGQLEAALSSGPKPKAAIFVHLYGSAAGVTEIAALLARHDVPLIEDAAQAIGTRVDGRAAGSIGLCGCFSTFPSKNLGGPGDGGFLCTDDDAFAERMLRMRNHGQTSAYEHEFVGGNFRIDALQAAVLSVRLRHLETFTEARRTNAARYRERLADCAALRLPTDVADRHAYNQFVIHCTDRPTRDRVHQALRQQEIGCAIYYPLPFHLQPCFRSLGHEPGEFATAEQAAGTNLALPIFPELREDELQQVADAVLEATHQLG